MILCKINDLSFRSPNRKTDTTVVLVVVYHYSHLAIQSRISHPVIASLFITTPERGSRVEIAMNLVTFWEFEISNKQTDTHQYFRHSPGHMNKTRLYDQDRSRFSESLKKFLSFCREKKEIDEMIEIKRGVDKQIRHNYRDDTRSHYLVELKRSIK